MNQKETHTIKSLTLEISNDDVIKILWQGKSTERNPGNFLNPILFDALTESTEHGKKIVMDFSELEFMNSSTVTPVAKMLENAKQGKNTISVHYNKTKKWQELSFSALKIFETEDGRISVIGN